MTNRGWEAFSAEASAENKRLKIEIERLRSLVRVLIDNDPDDMAADGITVLDVWRKEASTVLPKGQQG